MRDTYGLTKSREEAAIDIERRRERARIIDSRTYSKTNAQLNRVWLAVVPRSYE
jgi:hypothetical protein